MKKTQKTKLGTSHSVQIVILVYQILKPIWHQLNQTVFGVTYTCAHQPSCSRYTLQQVQQHGTIVGLYRGLKRLTQCWSGSL